MLFRSLLDEPRISECPVSYITPQSMELIQIVTTIRNAGQQVDLTELPGALVDALQIASVESKIHESAINEAWENS